MRCTFQFSVTANPNMRIRFFIHYTGTAPTVAQLNTFATSIRTAWTTNMASVCSTNQSLVGVFCQDLSSASGNAGQDLTAVAGTRAGTEAPIGIAIIIKRVGIVHYRGGHSKSYLPGGVQADLTDVRTWSVAFQNAVLTGYNALITAVLAAGWSGAGTLTEIIVHYFKGFTNVTSLSGRSRPRPTVLATPTTELVQAVGINPIVGSQRRRSRQSG